MQGSAGLENAGNTCYMNSSIQCLYRVPEVREALKVYDAQPSNLGTTMSGAHRLTVRLAGCMSAVCHLRPQLLAEIRQAWLPLLATMDPASSFACL